MKIKELIKCLQKCNPEAEAIGYTYTMEQDFVITNVKEVCIINNTDKNLEYCTGYSVVEDDYIGKPIVYLGE